MLPPPSPLWLSQVIDLHHSQSRERMARNLARMLAALQGGGVLQSLGAR